MVDGVTTTYLLDTATPLTMVLAEQTGAAPAIYYLHGLDLTAQSDGVTTEYFAYDGLGSVRQVADAIGSPLLTQTFDPYGSLYARAGIAETAWGFTGEYGDTNGLLYLRARYYAPSQGRFFQLDPSRLEVNPYQYSYSNPLSYTDPGGMLPELFGAESVQLGFGDLIEILNELRREETQVYGLAAVVRNLDTILDAAGRYDLDPALLAAVIDWESNAIERVLANHMLLTKDETAFLYDLDLWKYIFTSESSVGIGQVRIDRALYLEKGHTVDLPTPQLWFPLFFNRQFRVVRLERGLEIALGMSVSEPIAIEYTAANLKDIQNIIERSGLTITEGEISRLAIVAYNKGQEMIQRTLAAVTDCPDLENILADGYLTNQVGPLYDRWSSMLQ